MRAISALSVAATLGLNAAAAPLVVIDARGPPATTSVAHTITYDQCLALPLDHWLAGLGVAYDVLTAFDFCSHLKSENAAPNVVPTKRGAPVTTSVGHAITYDQCLALPLDHWLAGLGVAYDVLTAFDFCSHLKSENAAPNVVPTKRGPPVATSVGHAITYDQCLALPLDHWLAGLGVAYDVLTAFDFCSHLKSENAAPNVVPTKRGAPVTTSVGHAITYDQCLALPLDHWLAGLGVAYDVLTAFDFCSHLKSENAAPNVVPTKRGEPHAASTAVGHDITYDQCLALPLDHWLAGLGVAYDVLTAFDFCSHLKSANYAPNTVPVKRGAPVTTAVGHTITYDQCLALPLDHWLAGLGVAYDVLTAFDFCSHLKSENAAPNVVPTKRGAPVTTSVGHAITYDQCLALPLDHWLAGLGVAYDVLTAFDFCSHLKSENAAPNVVPTKRGEPHAASTAVGHDITYDQCLALPLDHWLAGLGVAYDVLTAFDFCSHLKSSNYAPNTVPVRREIAN